MNPEGFARLKEILLTLPKLPPGERERYLDSSCGSDDELRREVEAVLAAGSEDPSILRTAGLAGLFAEELEAELSPSGPGKIPARIGPYRVLGVLGEGGMGVVYRVQQTEPIRREVALKLIKRGMDTEEVIARFAAERKTLALMDHPHIAKVLDAGADEHGRPYFVMELVRGVPITSFCEAKQLSLAERLELFVPVCRAVQHAHQKGVIHRDLKPNNVIVTLHDGQPYPLIIDFGIAKATEDPVSGQTMITHAGQVVGTPDYMSPEQTTGDPRAVDVRTDVYALGVILYQLVSGELPYDLGRRSILEIARVLREQEPKPLSRTGVSRQRFDRDLETIVSTAIDKDVERRYASAAALAEDIERFLASQPILARPPTTIYQLRKLVARHKTPFALLGALGVLLLAFAVTMSALFGIQRRERRRAETEAAKAAEVVGFLQEMLRSVNPESQGDKDVTVRAVLDEASARIEREFANRDEVRAKIQGTIGATYSGLGVIDQAEPHLKAALASWLARLGPEAAELAPLVTEMPRIVAEDGGSARADSATARVTQLAVAAQPQLGLEVAAALRDLGCLWNVTGSELPEALLHRSALAIRQAHLEAPHPLIIESLNDFAMKYWALGTLAEAESLQVEAVEMCRQLSAEDEDLLAGLLDNLGVLRFTRFKYEGRQDLGLLELSARTYSEALAIRSRLHGEDDPRVATLLDRLVGVQTYFGDATGFARADSIARRRLAILRREYGERHPEVATAIHNLGVLHARHSNPIQDLDQAESYLREAMRIKEELYQPSDFLYVTTAYILASVLERKGELDEAIALLELSIPGRRATRPPDHWELPRDSLKLAHLKGVHEGRFVEYEGALRRNCELLCENPSVPPIALYYEVPRCIEFYEAWGVPERARPYLEDMIAVCETLGKTEEAASYRVQLEEWGSP